MCLHDGSLELQADTVPVAEKYSGLSPSRAKRGVYSIRGRKDLGSQSPEGINDEQNKQVMLLYLDKLRWAVEKAGYCENFADFIGSSFLGFDIDFKGNIPNAKEIIVCASMALLELVSFADIITILVDDFQVSEFELILSRNSRLCNVTHTKNFSSYCRVLAFCVLVGRRCHVQRPENSHCSQQASLDLRNEKPRQEGYETDFHWFELSSANNSWPAPNGRYPSFSNLYPGNTPRSDY